MILLEKEFDYFIAHQKELSEKYAGKYIVIKGHKILGAYSDILEAVEKTSKHEKLGTFLVQKCESGKEIYTQTYQSGVEFA